MDGHSTRMNSLEVNDVWDVVTCVCILYLHVCVSVHREGYVCCVTFPREMWRIVCSLLSGHLQTKGTIPFKPSLADSPMSLLGLCIGAWIRSY